MAHRDDGAVVAQDRTKMSVRLAPVFEQDLERRFGNAALLRTRAWVGRGESIVHLRWARDRRVRAR